MKPAQERLENIRDLIERARVVVEEFEADDLEMQAAPYAILLYLLGQAEEIAEDALIP